MDVLIVFCAAGAVLYTVHALITSWRQARRAAALGCKSPYQRLDKLPLGIDFVWNMFKADKENRVPQQLVKTSQETGHSTFVESLLGTKNIVTSDPKNVQAVLALQFKDFELGPRRRNNFYPLLGDGIFTLDGHGWEHARALLRPQFSRDQVADLALEERHVQNMFLHLHVDAATGWTQRLDLGPIFFRYTMDSATEFLFGESLQSQRASFDNQIPESERPRWAGVAARFDRATRVLGMRARLEGFFWLYFPSSFREDCREIHKFADFCIEKTLARKASGTKKADDRYIFLEQILDVTQDRIEVRSQLLNILLAGRDTTAGLLGWTFWCLARHPHVFAKLRAAILRDFGNGEEKAITFSGLKSCSYLQHVMSEVLRLYPPVPLNSRQATKETTLPRGGGVDGTAPVFVKKGQAVAYSTYVMHRRKDLWGEDADEFNPARWEGRKTGWEFLPFNGGPRVCLGQQFALTEAGYVITRLLQKFDRCEKMDSSDEPWHQYSLTSAPRNTYVALHRA
jgi:cytochrome P450